MKFFEIPIDKFEKHKHYDLEIFRGTLIMAHFRKFSVKARDGYEHEVIINLDMIKYIEFHPADDKTYIYLVTGEALASEIEYVHLAAVMDGYKS